MTFIGPNLEPPDEEEDRGGGWCDNCGGPLEDDETTDTCPHCAKQAYAEDQAFEQQRDRDLFGDD